MIYKNEKRIYVLLSSIVMSYLSNLYSNDVLT